jgi:hypothetical protein
MLLMDRCAQCLLGCLPDGIDGVGLFDDNQGPDDFGAAGIKPAKSLNCRFSRIDGISLQIPQEFIYGLWWRFLCGVRLCQFLQEILDLFSFELFHEGILLSPAEMAKEVTFPIPAPCS